MKQTIGILVLAVPLAGCTFLKQQPTAPNQAAVLLMAQQAATLTCVSLKTSLKADERAYLMTSLSALRSLLAEEAPGLLADRINAIDDCVAPYAGFIAGGLYLALQQVPEDVRDSTARSLLLGVVQGCEQGMLTMRTACAVR